VVGYYGCEGEGGEGGVRFCVFSDMKSLSKFRSLNEWVSYEFVWESERSFSSKGSSMTLSSKGSSMNPSSKIHTWCFCEQTNPGFFLLFKKEERKGFGKHLRKTFKNIFFSSIPFSFLPSGMVPARYMPEG